MLRTLRDTFWMLALAIILLFGFFVALGAFDPADVLGATIAIAGLVAAWIVHALVIGRSSRRQQDPAAMRARERRGF